MARVRLIILGLFLGSTPLCAQNDLVLSSGYSFTVDSTIDLSSSQTAYSSVLSNAFVLRSEVFARGQDFGVAFGMRLSKPAALYFSAGGETSVVSQSVVGEITTSSFQLGAAWRHALFGGVGLQLSGGLGLHTRETKRSPGTTDYLTVFLLTPQAWSGYRVSVVIEEGISLYWAGHHALGLWRYSEASSRAGNFHSSQSDQLLIELAPSFGLTVHL